MGELIMVSRMMVMMAMMMVMMMTMVVVVMMVPASPLMGELINPLQTRN